MPWATRRRILISVAGSACLFFATSSRAAMSDPVVYNGNGGSGSTVSYGSLTLQDNGYTVFGTFNKAPGTSFQLDLVIYIDSVAGGFNDNLSFRDNASPVRRAVSGFNTTLNQGSSAIFAPGFTADYAIVLGVNPPNGGNDLFRLHAGQDGSFDAITSVNLQPNNDLNSWSYTFQFSWSSIGIKAGDPHFFKFQSTYLDNSGSRTLESFETLGGTRNFGTVTFSNYNTYGVAPVPEMTGTSLTVFGCLFATSGVVATACRIVRRRAD